MAESRQSEEICARSNGRSACLVKVDHGYGLQYGMKQHHESVLYGITYHINAFINHIVTKHRIPQFVFGACSPFFM